MQLLWWRLQRRWNHSIFGRNTRMLSEAVESSPSPCKLDHGGLEPNAVAIYEEVMYRMLPLIHSSHYLSIYLSIDRSIKSSYLSDLEIGFAPRCAISSTSELPKAVRSWGVLHILTWTRASRHSVQFFVSHMTRSLRTRRFSEPTWPSPPTNHLKTHKCFATLLTHLYLLSSYSSLSLVYSSLSYSSLLCSLTLLIFASFHLSI